MKRFEVYAPLTKNLQISEEDNGALMLEGIASTTSKDLHGDVIKPEAIASMKKQALRKNIYADHTYDVLNTLIGNIKDVAETDDDRLKIKFSILPSYASKVQELLDNDIQLGLSIGGFISKFKAINDGYEVNDFDLKEISLTGMPANWDTFGTIVSSKGIVRAKCFEGACQKILSQKSTGDNMAEENNNIDETNGNEDNDKTLTVKEATDLFNELMAAKQNEIKSEIMDTMKNDIKKMIDDAVAEALGEEPEVEEVEVSEKDIGEIISKSIGEGLEELKKSQVEFFKEHMKQSTPDPTDKPEQKDLKNNDATKKKFTNKEIFEKLELNKKPSLFDTLGIKTE